MELLPALTGFARATARNQRVFAGEAMGKFVRRGLLGLAEIKKCFS
jgi:predicted transcriptional regulator